MAKAVKGEVKILSEQDAWDQLSDLFGSDSIVCFFPSKQHDENKDGVWWFKNKEIELAYNNSDSANH